MGTNLGLHRFAALVAASTLILIFVGGLVTSTGSGLAVPDWPLSFGKLFPEMTGGVLYEHGHRLVAATVGLFTIILAIWIWRTEPRPWVRWLGALALLAIICQGALGGITVLFRLPTAVSLGHAALAQIFLCLTVSLMVFTSKWWKEDSARLEDHGNPSLKSLSATTSAIIYAQILTGALTRHTASGLAIPDFPLSYGHVIPPFFTRQILIHFIHRVGALVVIFFVTWLAFRVLRHHRAEKALVRQAVFLVSVLGAQILLGAETIWSSRATIPTTAHVAVGALTLSASLYLTLRVHRIVFSHPALEHTQAACTSPATE